MPRRPKNPTDLLTTAEAAGLLGLSEREVQRLCLVGRFGRRHHRTWILTRGEISAYRRRPRGRPEKVES